MQGILNSLSAAAFCLAAFPMHAAEIFLAEPFPEGLFAPFPSRALGAVSPEDLTFDLSDRPHVRLEGDIEPGDADKLGSLLQDILPEMVFNTDHFNDVIVSLNSEGGNFFEGLAIADLLRGLRVGTYVGAGDVCLSSCAFAFLGGSTQFLRGFPPEPNRLLHVDGTLGFHAPFSLLSRQIQIADGTPLSDPILNRMAESFYDQAQGAVRELAGRVEDWSMKPGFMFTILTTKSPKDDARPLNERFILIDTYEKAEAIATVPLAAPAPPLRNVTLTDALDICWMVWDHNTDGMLTVSGLPNGTDQFQNDAVVAEGEVIDAIDGKGVYGPIETSGSDEPKIVAVNSASIPLQRLLPADTLQSFFLEGLTSGMGGSACNVFRSGTGWAVRTLNRDAHMEPEGGPGPRQHRLLDYKKSFPLNIYTRLGNDRSWSNPAPDFVEYGDIEGFEGVTGPSFSCSADLDPAAEVICAYPELARQDGILGQLYDAARKKAGQAVRDSQRRWVAIRNRACGPERLDPEDPFGRASLAECLYHFTRFRNTELLEIVNGG